MLQEEATLNDIAARYDVSPIMLSRWKSEFLERAADVFKKGQMEAEKELIVEKERVAAHTAPSKDSKTFVKGSPEWEIHEEVLKRKYDCIIEKHLPGSFTGTGLEDVLKEKGIDTVVICGYMSQMCCDTTSRQAVHLGYQVEFLSDATGTLNISNYAGSVTAEERHRAIIVTQAMRFSKVMSSDEWVSMKSASRLSSQRCFKNETSS